MNEIVKLYNDKPVRIIELNGEPWFVAKDVCELLDINKYRDAVARLAEDERCPVMVDTPSGKQEMVSVNEAGLYSLILRSRKKEAQKFKRWVTHEVLPSIRKTGNYGIQPMSMEAFKAMQNTDVGRRITTEIYAERMAKCGKQLAMFAIPATPFGEISKETGRPRTKLVKSYLRSEKTVKQEHLDTYQEQLLFPFLELQICERECNAIKSLPAKA